MKKNTIRNILFSLLSSVLLFVAWPPSDFNFILLFAFVPVLMAVFEQKKTRKAFLYFYFSFQLFLILIHSPLLIEGDYFIPLSIGLVFIPVIWSIPVVIAHKIAKYRGLSTSLFLFPFIYLSQEVLQYYWDFGMTYFNMGVGLSNTPFFLGIYPFLGQEGGTLLILGFNCGLVFLFQKIKNEKVEIFHALPLGLFVLIIAITYLTAPDAQKTGTLQVAIFQPDKQKMDSIKNNLSAKIDLLETEIEKNKGRKIDLIICPESFFVDMEKKPLIVNNLETHEAIQKLMFLSSEYGVPIFSGAILVEMFRADEPPTPSAKPRRNEPGVYFDVYNGSVFVTPDKQIAWRTKQSLVPFSESIPFYKAFNYLERKGLWPTRYDKTYGVVPFEGPFRYKNINIAPVICFESVFPVVVDSYIQNEANLIVVLSTNWTTSQRVLNQQQDAMSIVQKSFGKTVLYATLDQQSSVTDFKGQREFSSSPFEVKEVRLHDSSSMYALVASKPWCWIVLSLILVFLVVSKKNI